MSNITIHQGDCLEFIYTLKPKSIKLIIIDPPYFEIKGHFDFIWKTFDDYLAFMDKVAQACKYALADNGSLFVFGHAKRIAYVQVIFDKYFNLENSLVWEVYDRQTNKGIDQFRCFAPITERCLFYSNHNPTEWDKTGLKLVMNDVNNFQTLRGYFKQVQEFIGSGKNTIIEKIGQKADHCFRHSSTQWDLPTAETYAQLIAVFGIDKMDGFREYESLRLEYESLRLEYESLRLEYESLRLEYESLRRPFNNVHRLTDVIRHSQEAHLTKEHDHDTVKPVGLISKLIQTCSNEGDLVADFFVGSGTTAEACERLNRDFVGCDLEQKYVDMTNERIRKIKQQHDLINMFY
jgi:site-specific DNA-methyltransferase (adenine-specific)